MHDSVRCGWVDFNEPLEGIVLSFYADVLGLITIGMGCLVDPLGAALALPMQHPDGTYATRAEIATAWHAVKSDPACKVKGWRYAAALPANQLRLSRSEVETLIFQKLGQLDAAMRYRFDHWDDWPAPAQMGVLSMCWAMGSGFVTKFPKFTAACRRGDWATAAAECAISPERGTVVERNRRNRALFLEAAGASTSV